MLLPDSDGLGAGVLVNPVLDRLPGVLHGFTTRLLGSVAQVGEASQPDAVDVALGARRASWIRHDVRQVHGAGVIRVDDSQATELDADALVARAASRLVVVRTADCVPVLIAGIGRGRAEVVAAVHAGWRGLLAGVIERAVVVASKAAPGTRLVAAIGPAIGPCCYEVGADVRDAFVARFGAALISASSSGGTSADLPRAARQVLTSLAVAVPDPQPPPCTRCAAELFHSFRRDGATAGRMGAFIGIEAGAARCD